MAQVEAIPASEEFAETLDLLRTISVCDVSDALTRLNLRNVRMRGVLPLTPFAPDAKHMAGPAVTIRFVPSHYKTQYRDVPDRLTEIVEAAPKGSVVVVEGGDLMPVQGEMNCLTAIRAGHEGSVGDGPVRDVDALRETGFPIFHKVAPIGIMMETYVGNLLCAGANQYINCAGALVRPGDVIVGDNNGVVVVPRDRLSEIVAVTREIVGLEEELKAKIAAGATWRDIYRSTHAGKYGRD
jgi:regulator of RNase E activity RraA